MILQTIIKNKYFILIFVGIALILGSIWYNPSKNSSQKTPSTNTSNPAVADTQLRTLSSGPKEFSWSSANLNKSSVENIASFDSSEGWQGWNGNILLDEKNFYEEKSSFSISSFDRKEGIIFLNKSIDLSNFKTIELFMSLDNAESAESVVIKFGDSALSNYYSYSISNFTKGWKLVQIPQDQFVATKTDKNFSWKDIKKIQISIVSRPNTMAVANFDYLTAQKNLDYQDLWKTTNKNFLSLGKINDKVLLAGRNESASQAVLNDINASDFAYQASFIPERAGGGFGLFFRGNYSNGKGYYLMADGIGKNSVSLSKFTASGMEVLKKAEVSNLVFEKDAKYWLKVQTKDQNITCSISLKGTDFTELFSVNDSDYPSGGVGISVTNRAYGFFDDFKFNQ